MGYLSDVGLCLTAEGVKRLDAALNAARSETGQGIHQLLTYAEKREEHKSGSVAWFWEGIKWYWGYADVDFIENLLNELPCADYFFIRVGESDDDTEVRGGFRDNPFHMYLLRGIAFD